MEGRDALLNENQVENPKDNEVKGLDQKRHQRTYNPVDDAERASVSDKLNSDSSKYRKGPGPV
jgi:hypothetical protein